MSAIPGQTPAPPPPAEAFPLRRLERVIGRVLEAGVALSLLCILGGALLSARHHAGDLSSPEAFARLTRPQAAVPHTLREIAAGVCALRGQAIIALGLVVLILTPVARVGVSMLIFIREGDRIYALLTLGVLLILILSFVLGRAG
jgi:uncharacterized membrane protein